jgi:hypothetical protein
MAVSAMSLALVLALPSVSYGERRRRLPAQPGLYFAIRKSAKVIYIGMSTKSIRSRWIGDCNVGYAIHRKEIDPADIRVAYLVYDDISGLKDEEREAIREFSPVLNYSHVPGAYERDRRRRVEECPYINCHDHFHEREPQKEPPTQWGPCDCSISKCAIYPNLTPPA